MKTKFNGILTLLLALVVQISFAQDRTISGTVSDETGPLPGVSILKKGTTQGTETDFDGNYTIKVKTGDVLVFSFVGMETVEKTIAGSNKINVVMQSGNVLEEVVVTALGVKSKPRELSTAVQTVKADEISNSNETNVATALASKAAGVQVTASSGSVGSSANIRVRGNTSINRSNSPLFVVDGVPIDNSSTGNGTAGVDNSNRAIDINQNDIESISILKGIAAQTLYGLRASNGVIIITTKSGKSGKPKVNVSSNITFSEVGKLPALQKLYAQGRPRGGVPTYRGPETREGFSWGPAIADLEFDGDSNYPYDKNGKLVAKGTGNGTAAKAYDNYGFFKTGIQTDLNVSVSGGSDVAKYFVSGGLLEGTGVSPTEKFARKSFRANINSQLTEKLTLDVSGAFVNSGGRRVQRGSNISGIMLGLLRTTPTFDNGNGLEGSNAADNPDTFTTPSGSQRSYRAGVYDNPYWTVAKNPALDDVNRFIGNLQLKYQFNDWLSAQAKYGFDRFTDSRKIAIDVGSATNRSGQVTTFDLSNRDITSQLILTANKELSEKVNLGATIGVDNFNTYRQSRQTVGSNLTIPGFFHVSNTSSQENYENVNRKKLTGVLGNLTLGFDDMLFLNASFRNDWSSTLPKDNNSFQSYSVGGSFIFTELFENNDSALNYGKLRASWGKSGNDAPLYATNTYYGAGSAGGDGFIDNNVFPIFSTVAFERSSSLGNNKITPETTTEYEVGAELKFFNNRIGIDVAYYDKRTEDQIIYVDMPATTGYTERVMNAGVISNKGIEATLNITPVKTEDFSWDADFNFTKMKNKVESLAEGVPPILLSGFTSTSSRIVEGESYGAIYGGKWLRDDQGRQIVDDNGLAVRDPEAGVVGDPIPDFTLGIRNTLRYKRVSLTALLDIREGGDVWCGTCGILDYFGVSEKTGRLRNETYVVNGVTSTGAENTKAVPYADPAAGLGGNRWVRYGFGGVSEDNVHDGSFVKLREVALSYSFPNEFIEKAGITSASITLAGRNLWTHTKYPGIDPETNLTGASNGLGLDYFNQPQTKSYSLGLKLSF